MRLARAELSEPPTVKSQKSQQARARSAQRRHKRRQHQSPPSQKLFDDPLRRSENYPKRSRLEQAARDVADGKITLEELNKALHDAVVTDRNIR
jgi:hypothetical protein